MAGSADARHAVSRGGVSFSHDPQWEPAEPAGDTVLIVSPGNPDPIFGDASALTARGVFHCKVTLPLDSVGEVCSLDAINSAAQEIDTFFREITARRLSAPGGFTIVGSGSAALVAAVWVHDYAPPVRLLVLHDPALTPRDCVPGMRAVPWDQGGFGLPPAYRSTAARIIEDAGAIPVPVRVLRTAHESRIDDQALARFADQLPLGPGDVEYRGLQSWVEFADWLRTRSGRDESPSTASLAASLAAHTRKEFDAHCRPLPLFSRERAHFAWQKLLLRTVGRLSTGIRLGLRTGFDSGSTMDYVYRCESSGMTRLGRLIDEAYLQSAGWKSIRVRRRNLQVLIIRAAGQLRAAGMPVRIADIAAGPGRYVMEAAQRIQPRPEHIRFRDCNPRDVRDGTALISNFGLEDIAVFEQADAFDRPSLESMSPRPTLVIICGLYELYPDNEPVVQSLAGVAEVIEPGGVLIYSGMPWHPELEYIGRVLPSHRPGHRCATRRRTQFELDHLVEAAGFMKTGQMIDPWGIFSVSITKRC